eukprot:5341519-Ditylum_brightwellii.AAC.1
MGLLWEEFGEEEGWGILLVDARNAFNELNRKAMIWHVSVLRGDADVVYSKEGVTQGDAMAMFLHALGVLPIINQLKHHQLDVESLTREVERLQA